jgi:FkbM family methyltransferase
VAQVAQMDRHVSAAQGSLLAATINGLARWTPYVESEIRGLRRLVHPGDVCVDVGAAAGLYTAVLSHLTGPGGSVHSIEPLPFANLQLARLVQSRPAANVHRHAVALGAQRGTDVMHVPVGRYGLVTGRSFLDRSARGPDPNVEFPGQVAVTVTIDTLDDLCRRAGIERLHFVKVDVEGAELQVLEGGDRVISDSRPVMLIEIEARHTARYERTPEEVVSWLSERGYSMHTWQGGWRSARTVDPGTRNYLFLPTREGSGPSVRPRAPLALVGA